MLLQLSCLFVFVNSVLTDDLVHNPIQYHSQTPRGQYNYGYDTGLYGSHQFHQEKKDNAGIVHGRYGYTDPDGKLRLTYYTAGPNGYNVIKENDHHNEVKPVPVAASHPAPVLANHTPHNAPLVVTSPCKYRNPPCNHGRVVHHEQVPEKVNTYSEKSTHHQNTITTTIRDHPPAPVHHVQTPPVEHAHHHKHHRNHDSHSEVTPSLPAPVVHTPVIAVAAPAPVVTHHVSNPVHTVNTHEDTVNTHSKTVTKTVHTPPQVIIPAAPVVVEAIKAPVVQQVHHQDIKGHRSPVQIYRGNKGYAVTPKDYAKGRYVPNYKPSSPYSRCWCE